MTTTPLRASARPLSGPRVAPRTPPSWVDEPYTRFTVTPLTPTIGAYVSDISLAQPVDAETHAELHRALLEWKGLFFRGQHLDAAERDALRPDFPPVEHPVVRTHPETGRKTLFVNAAFTQYIVGMAPEESGQLLDLLYRQAAYPEYQCRFHWAPGDVAFWDNRST